MGMKPDSFDDVGKKTGIEILSVEDSSADQLLIAEMLKASERKHRVTFVSDGEEAIKFLRQQGEYSNAPRPDVILLDMGLPKKNGDEVLKEIRQDNIFSEIPVLILTTSEVPRDALKCRELKGNCYIRKPTDPDHFRLILRTIEHFCDSLDRSLWIELSPHLIRKELESERASRRAEREALKEKLWQLQLKILSHEKNIKRLEQQIGAPKTPENGELIPTPPEAPAVN
jgi:two-component system, chemotaxis family, response regulator Rcp1